MSIHWVLLAIQRLADGTSKTTTPFTGEEGEPAAKIAKDSPIMEHRPTADSLGINQSLDEMIDTTGGGVGENGSGQLRRGGCVDGDVDSDGDLDLEGISDSEIDTMILKPAEVERYVRKTYSIILII